MVRHLVFHLTKNTHQTSGGAETSCGNHGASCTQEFSRDPLCHSLNSPTIWLQPALARATKTK